jgi:spore maturation protein CgeB
MGTRLSALRLGDSQLKRALAYPKFRHDRPRVVVLDGNYHLHRECQAALGRLGCEVSAVKVGPACGDLLRELLGTLIERRPDLLLSVNQIGFDAEGVLGEILEETELPVAAWYVDSPLFILRGTPFPAARVSSVFLWERTLCAPLRALGVEDVSYLPLATDPLVFAPVPAPAATGPLSFVGDSMEHAREKWGRRLDRRGGLRAAALRDRLLRGERLDAILEADRLGRCERDWDIVAHGTYTATAEYRLDLLRAVAGPELHLYGDPGWERLLPSARWRGPVEYGRAAAAVYAGSEITLNATSFQMPTAVNQRVFDVPAAGGFLLTDARDDLAELFEPGREAIAFRDSDELADLVRHYRAHPEERRAITTRARSRVLAEHSYEHRLSTLLAHVAERHSGRAAAARAGARP